MEKTETIKLNKDGLLSRIKSLLLKLESEATKQIRALMYSEAKSAVDDELNELVSDFKKIVNITNSSGTSVLKNKFSNKLYKAVMDRVFAVEAPKISGGSNNEGYIIRQLGEYIANLLDTNTEIVDGYTLSNPAGSNVAYVTATDVSGNSYTFTWNNTDAVKTSFSQFFENAKAFTEERLTTGILTAFLYDARDSGLIDTAGDWLSKLAKTFIRNNKLSALSKLDDMAFFRELAAYKKSTNATTDLDLTADKLFRELKPFLQPYIIIDRKTANIYDNMYKKRYKILFEKATNTFNDLAEFIEMTFTDSNKAITNILNKYDKFLETCADLGSYIENYSGSDESLIESLNKKSSDYQKFIVAFNALETTMSQLPTSFNGILDEYTVLEYEFSQVTDADIFESNALINGTDDSDTIRATGMNVTINANSGDDKIITIGLKTVIHGGKGNDGIGSSSTDSEIYGDEGDDFISVEGDSTSANGGIGSDTIVVSASNAIVDGGENFDGLPVSDTIIITSDAENAVINNFEKDDTLDLSAYDLSELSAGKYQSNSLEIWSRKTHKTIAILEDVTGGTNENIICKDAEGNVIAVSLDWILANTPAIVNPYDAWTSDDSLKPSQIVSVPINGNVNNSRDNVIIAARSGNNSIENSGSNVTIDGGTDTDAITSSGNNVTVDGKAGNDFISNGAETAKGGDNVSVNGGLGGDLIYNYAGVNIEILGGEDNDTINNTGNNAQITGDSGNDEINNNGGNNVTVDGGDGNDALFSSGNAISVFGGNGEDSIRINASGANATVNGGNDDDNISNYGSNALIDGDDGNDILINEEGSNVIIDGGNGDDSINSHNGQDITILGGSGFDRIYNRSNNSIIDSGTDNDTITNSGDNTEINSETGNNLISNIGSSVLILTGDGNNTIGNVGSSDRGSNVTINSGMGDDSISNSGDNVSINSNGGNDTIRNSNGSSVSITGGIGNDSIYNNNSKSVLINSGDGNDSIENNYYSDNISIVSGSGDDYIYNGQNKNISIDSGEGNDTIHNKGNDSTIVGGYGNDEIRNYGNNVSINTSAGNDSILNGSDNSIIDGGDDNDTINNHGSNVTIDGGTGDDFIVNYEQFRSFSEEVSINAGDGNDYIRSENSTGATINSGSGDDVIYICNDYSDNNSKALDSKVSIVADIGNDSIYIEKSSNVNLSAGAGDDLISLDSCLRTGIEYRTGDGNDTIYGLNASDTLFIVGEEYSYTKSGIDDLILIVGDSKITLVNSASAWRYSLIHIEGTLGGNDTTPADTTPAYSAPEGATIIDGAAVTLSSDDKKLVIDKRGASLKGYTLDKAFISNEANAATIVNLINATDSSQLVLDSGTFYGKGQSPVVLEDYDTLNGTFVNIKTADGRKTILGWSPLNGGIVDGNSIDKPQVIFGDAPNGNSTIRGSNRNDSIYAGAKDIVSLSGGHDDLYINDETAQGVTVDMGDGSALSRTRIVDGSLKFIKGDSCVTFDELATFDDANGLQLQIDGRTYELRNDYNGGLKDVDYFWTDTDGNYYITDSTFRIHDDGSTCEYFIGEGSGRLTINGFKFGRDKDKLNLTTINGLKTYGDNLYIEIGDSDVVEVTGGAGKTIDVKLDGTTYTA